MLSTAFIAILVVGAIGIGVTFAIPLGARRQWYSDDKRITWSEYGLAMLFVIAVVMPLVLWIGSKLSIDNQLTYQEFRNGVEVAAQQHKEVYGRDALDWLTRVITTQDTQTAINSGTLPSQQLFPSPSPSK